MTGTLQQSLVRIWGRDGRVVGAGFLVAKREVLTCAHVASMALDHPQSISAPAGTLLVDFPLLENGSKPIPAAIIRWIPEETTGKGDIAGLVLHEAPPSGARPVTLVSTDNPWGQTFRTFGFPAGARAGAWASGVLRDREGTGWLQIDAEATTGRRVGPGFSGAPVEIQDEALPGVVGMVVAADKQDRDRVAFVIPTATLIQAWPTMLSQRNVAACPYRGLSAFRERDAEFFFGREEQVPRLVETVRHQRVVAVLGPSGSGKSSLVLAGLLPALRNDERWQIGSFRPGRDPFGKLAIALLQLLDPSLGEASRLEEAAALARVLRADQLAAAVERILDKTGADRVLLVADQFEELFTLCTDIGERHAFLDAFISAGLARPDALTVVLTMRSDFYSEALQHPGLRAALEGRKVNLGDMTTAQLRRAIEEPARRLGVELADGLVDRILVDVGEGPGRLPLLEFSLTRLWEHQHQGHLPHDGYTQIGRVDGALTQYAERVFKDLPTAEQARVRRVFGHLVMISEGVEATGRVAIRADLTDEDWAIVQQLADHRLLVTDRDAAGQETAQVVHEALIQSWPRLRDWVSADRSYLRWRDQVRAALRLWEQSGQDEGDLLRGVRLSEAESWCADRAEDADERILRFVRASRLANAKELLMRAGSHLHRGLHDEAISCYEQASVTLSELGDRESQLEAVRALVELHLEATQFEPALRSYREALKVLGPDAQPDELTEVLLERIAGIPAPYPEPKGLQAFSLFWRWRQWVRQANADKLHWYRRALTVHRHLGRDREQALINDRLGELYLEIGDLERGLWYTKRALRGYRALDDQEEQELLIERIVKMHGLRGEAVVAIRRWRELTRLGSGGWRPSAKHILTYLVLAFVGIFLLWFIPFVFFDGIIDGSVHYIFSLVGTTTRIDPSKFLPNWFDVVLASGAFLLARSVGGSVLRVTLATFVLIIAVEGLRWLQTTIPWMWGFSVLINPVLLVLLIRWLILTCRWSPILPYTRQIRAAARWYRHNVVDSVVGFMENP